METQTDTAPAPRDSRPMSIPVLAALLLSGAVLAGILYHKGGPPGLSGVAQLVLVALAAGLAAVPVVNRLVARLIDRVRNPSPRGRAWTGAGVWIVAVLYLAFTAHHQNRDLFPRIHDECSYTIQARMMAQGRLWQPQHELADFFETFHFLTRPVYGSIYFPGTALMNVPGIWLRQPSWMMPVMIAALIVAFGYRVTAEMVDGAAGLLVALLLLSDRLFRTYSTMVMGQEPVLLLGMLMVWAWLRWRTAHNPRWAGIIGAFAGWAAITRPVDALAFALPVGLAMAWELRGSSGRQIGRAALALLIGAAPFVELQVLFNRGVTGRLWKSPYVLYLEQNQPGAVFGSDASALARPDTNLPQKLIYFHDLVGGEKMIRRAGTATWLGLRARMTAIATLPCAILLALIPAGILLARDRARWVVLGCVPVFLALYLWNPFYLLHYGIALTAAAGFCEVLGARALEAAMPKPGARAFVSTFLTAALVLLAVGSLPELNPSVSDEPYKTPLLDYTNRALAQIPSPAVVLFHFVPGGNVHEEPVYNMDVTWPDDAPVIRAHDLGPRNGELLKYYAARQPERSYYMFDRRSGQITPLGNALQAAEALHVPLELPAEADVR